nr:hypothetical protein [uncultured Carboxylicivirga sp.]
MAERAVYIKSDGFKPKTFIDIPEEAHFDILHDNGLLKATIEDEERESDWQKIFFDVNKTIGQCDFGYTTCNLTETAVSEEILKIMQNIGNTFIFVYLNIDKKDWLHRITEYMVYMERSIASISGTVIYWKTLIGFFEQDGVVSPKSKQLLQFILRKNDIISCHNYFDEVLSFSDIFPFKPLGIEKIHIHDIASVLELYPQGKLNRYISAHFTKIPKELSREKIKELLHTHLETALCKFSTEDLWKKGDSDSIMEFLTECAIQENKNEEQELLHPYKHEYTSIIKQWLGSQKKLIKNLNDIQQMNLNPSKTTSEPAKEPEIPKYDAKYYALFIRIQEQAGREIPFVKNEYDRFPKAKIEAFAKNRFPGISTLQFYNHYRDLEDMGNKVKIARSYPNLKKIVADVAKNDADVLFHLKGFPD